MTPDQSLILRALRIYRDRTAHQISQLTGLWSARLYPVLMDLEERRIIAV